MFWGNRLISIKGRCGKKWTPMQVSLWSRIKFKDQRYKSLVCKETLIMMLPRDHHLSAFICRPWLQIDHNHGHTKLPWVLPLDITVITGGFILLWEASIILLFICRHYLRIICYGRYLVIIFWGVHYFTVHEKCIELLRTVMCVQCGMSELQILSGSELLKTL